MNRRRFVAVVGAAASLSSLLRPDGPVPANSHASRLWREGNAKLKLMAEGTWLLERDRYAAQTGQRTGQEQIGTDGVS